MFSRENITLRKIEAEKGIDILYAVESGSRAWGFASPDSDVEGAAEVPTKKYLYVVRPIVALLYLEQNRELPPTNFLETLREVELNNDTRNAILDLVERKRAGFELGMDKPIPVLNAFAEEHLNKWMQHDPEKHGERRSFRELDDIVLAILEGR